MPLRQRLFRLLAAINRAVLPALGGRDLQRLSPLEKALVGYRYWVTRNAL